MSQDAPAHKTALEVLRERVNGYQGYDESSNRESSDRQLRQHLVEKIKGLLSHLNRVAKTSEDKDQEQLEKYVQSAKRTLSTICTSLENPTYDGILDSAMSKMKTNQLECVYHFESGMVEETLNLENEMSTLIDQALTREFFEEAFLHINDFMDNFNQHLFEREALMLGDDV